MNQCYEKGDTLTISYKAVCFPKKLTVDVQVCTPTNCTCVDTVPLQSGSFSIDIVYPEFQPGKIYNVKFMQGQNVVFLTNPFFVSTNCADCTPLQITS